MANSYLEEMRDKIARANFAYGNLEFLRNVLNDDLVFSITRNGSIVIFRKSDRNYRIKRNGTRLVFTCHIKDPQDEVDSDGDIVSEETVAREMALNSITHDEVVRRLKEVADLYLRIIS